MLVLVIILDGCNSQYIKKTLTPFLYQLKKIGTYREIKFSPTFANRVELLTGNYPSTTNTFVDFCFDPDKSPFRLFRYLKYPTKLKKRSKLSRSLLKIMAVFTSRHKVDPINIPTSLLPYFSLNKSFVKFCQSEIKRTADHPFGYLEKKGINVEFFVIEDEKNLINKLKTLDFNRDTLLFLHYTNLDKEGHFYGPNSLQIKKSLGIIDKSVKSVYNYLKDKTNYIFIVSDHDMIESKKTVDVWGVLQKLKVKSTKDYFVFLNSPLARFWFKNTKAKKEIMKLLNSLKDFGYVIQKHDLISHKLPFDNKYGEVIFWAKKGVSISPDFYHIKKIKGMHNYLDSSNKTILIAMKKNAKIKIKKTAHTVDLFPTLLQIFKIKRKVDGECLLLK